MRKAIALAAIIAAITAGCAREAREEPVEVYAEPEKGPLVHATSIRVAEYQPESAVSESESAPQYIVSGTWHWQHPPEAQGACQAAETCPARIPPSAKELRQQQLPERPSRNQERNSNE